MTDDSSRSGGSVVIEEYDDLATTPTHEVVLDCLAAGIEAAHPTTVVADTVDVADGRLSVCDESYDLDEYERVVVLGGGNAAGKVAEALESELGDRVDDGAVVTDVPAATSTVEVLRGGHPVPSERGREGAERVRDLAATADEDTLVLGIVTGGGSALLPVPARGLSLEDLRATTDELLASGATIQEINAVRKHLSSVKGGRLAALAAPATVVNLVLSDVVGNDVESIASGPLAPDSSTFEDALAVVDRYELDVPASVRSHIERGVEGDEPETPGPNDAVFDTVDTYVLADGYTALRAARDVARRRGYDPHVLSSRVRGEARESAKTHVAIAEEVLATGNPVEPPAILLSGGETTVTVRGDGTGGPNQEFALGGALELDRSGIVLASVDTDGVDGTTDAAGAIVDANTVTGPDPTATEALDANDAYPFLSSVGALVETGPTGTNVNDLRVIAIDRE